MFRKSIDYLSVALEWIAIACFITTVGLVIASVCLRPLQIAAPWSDEAACWLFIWTSFLSAAVVLKRDLHIRIDVVLLHLPSKWRERLLFFLNILCLLFCIGLLYGICLMIIASYHMNSPALGIPMFLYYLPLLIGFAMMFIYLAIFIWDFIVGKQIKVEGS
jgi:TRAP-type C4-dicarboxylate transport system permease small subunit